MDWVLRSPQVHSTFGNIGFTNTKGYNINGNCNVALEAILHNILSEDKYLLSYRRSVGFSDNIKKDLIPLLLHTEDDKTIELLVKIFVNLTVPIECLLSFDEMIKTDFGRHTIFEITNLLASTKIAFTDNRTTKVVIDFLRRNMDLQQRSKLTTEQCINIGNILLLLRNILHIPESASFMITDHNASVHTVQNQIMWNIFSQSVDKLLVKLMTLPESANWGVTMVQLIALFYKDQHVVTLHKLLNMWLETNQSESSEDNESNTSPPDRGSGDSSPLLTSEPASDSSDTGGNGNSNNSGWSGPSEQNNQDLLKSPPSTPNVVKQDEDEILSDEIHIDGPIRTESEEKTEKKMSAYDTSDCGYGTQIENQGSISTSSNDDEVPAKKPIHHKNHVLKQRANKMRPAFTVQDRKRKKIMKRGKANITNVQGLVHNTPTDDEISGVLKEFTIDFLFKGYNSLVETLHNQILTNTELDIDTSHFFWLLTYFLKFGTQIELSLEYVHSVLTFDVMSYLIAEGVNLSEQIELTIEVEDSDIQPLMRRLHLVVTSIREFVQAVEVYKKKPDLSQEDQETLQELQNKICQPEELRSLLVLLLRHYNPKYHTKQYLQDLIVTNHIVLMFIDSVMKSQQPTGSNMSEHIQQLASPAIMYQYGLLLEDYAINGEFVNDCVFTLLHHVSGESKNLSSLWQPTVLNAFNSIMKSEFELSDDWSDLVEYVLKAFVQKQIPHKSTIHILDTLKDENLPLPEQATKLDNQNEAEVKNNCDEPNSKSLLEETWTGDEIGSLNWNYMQLNHSSNVIVELVQLLNEDGINKSKYSIIKELYRQNSINKEKYDAFMMEMLNEDGIMKNQEIDQLNSINKDNCDETMNEENDVPINKETRFNEIDQLCEIFIKEGKIEFLEWVQDSLLKTCYTKIQLGKRLSYSDTDITDCKVLSFECFKKKPDVLPALSPVCYHALMLNRSIPLVPWNCAKAAICKDLKFLQLLRKLGFLTPLDTGRIFIRIPHFWTVDYLFEIAGKLLPIDPSKVKAFVDDIADFKMKAPPQPENIFHVEDNTRSLPLFPLSDVAYQILRRGPSTTMNYTPTPGPSVSKGNGQDVKNARMNTQNWLEFVQKSHEMKLPSKSHLMEEKGLFSDTAMDYPSCSSGSISPSLVPGNTDGINTQNSFLNKFSSKDYRNDFAKECGSNDNISETASIASNLTRMCVSDEEDKPEEDKSEDNNTRANKKLLHTNGEAKLKDLEDCSSRKRPRVQLSPII